MMPTGVILPSSICYIHCNFCNTMLAVNVPGNNSSTMVAVKCGHCSNLLSVNVGDLLPTTLPNLQELKAYDTSTAQDIIRMECGSTSMSPPTAAATTLLLYTKPKDLQEQMLPVIPSPGKRRRVPTAYNRFIKEEIQRIKANNPEISHRQAFSTAAKNWAHLPAIHFGLTSDGNKQPADTDTGMPQESSRRLKPSFDDQH